MPLESAAPLPPIGTEPTPSLGRLLLIPLGILALMQAILALQGLLPVLSGALADPDGYMRLNRVLHLLDGGAWFDPRYPSINWPDGHVQHWTRALDILLLAGTGLLQPLLGTERALHVFGTLFSPLCLGLAILALSWALAPVLDRNARLFACLALLLQPSVLAYGSLGRPDHHSLLLLLCVVFLGLVTRLNLVWSRRDIVRAGAIAALALWVSPEALVFIAIGLLALGLPWLLGDPDAAAGNRRCALGIALWLVPALLVERGLADLFAAESDRLSIVHLGLFALIAAFWAVVAALSLTNGTSGEALSDGAAGPRLRGGPPPGEGAGARIAGRVALAALGMLGVGGTLLLLFPELRHGPLGRVDPLYQELRLRWIVEIQPLLRADWLAAGRYGELANRMIQMVGIGLLALPYLAWRLCAASAQRRFWVMIALGLALFLPLAFHQVRWAGYAQLLLAIVYGALIAHLLEWLGRSGPRRQIMPLRALTLTLALFWPMLVSAPLPRQTVETVAQACPIERLAAFLEQQGDPTPRTIMTLADFGPEILYRTPHRVLSIPNHRPQPGFAATHEALTANREERAKAILERHRVDWILLCRTGTEDAFYQRAAADRETLYHRLLDGHPPAWLRQVDLPPTLRDHVLLFAHEDAPSRDDPAVREAGSR